MEEGLGPCVVVAVGELSQEEAGELSLQSLVVGGPAVFLVDICGLAESLVPAYTNSSIFCEKLRSGDAGERDSVSGERGIFCPGAGERDSVSGERGSSSDISGDCNVLSWHPGCFPESPWVLSLGAVVMRHSLHVMSSVGRAQPGCP